MLHVTQPWATTGTDCGPNIKKPCVIAHSFYQFNLHLLLMISVKEVFPSRGKATAGSNSIGLLNVRISGFTQKVLLVVLPLKTGWVKQIYFLRAVRNKLYQNSNPQRERTHTFQSQVQPRVWLVTNSIFFKC